MGPQYETHITLLTSRILRWLLDLWEIVRPLQYYRENLTSDNAFNRETPEVNTDLPDIFIFLKMVI